MGLGRTSVVCVSVGGWVGVLVGMCGRSQPAQHGPGSTHRTAAGWWPRCCRRTTLPCSPALPALPAPPLRPADKARDFGAGPLFNQILPLLMSPTLEDQERHLLVKVGC